MSSTGCSLCGDIVRRARSVRASPIPPSTLHQLFHSNCETCSQPHSDWQELCQFCTHLRPRHLSVCYALPVIIYIYRAEALFNQSECALCRVVLESALIQFGDWYEIPRPFELAFLRPRKLGESHDREDMLSHDRESLRFQLVEVQSDIGISILDCGTLPPGSSSSIGLAPLQRRINDWSLIRAQLDRCVDHHSKCGIQHGELPASFRVIDVLERRIVPFPQNQRFVALSYVWGVNPNPMFHIAMRSSIKNFEMVGGLPSTGMPQTIEDALVVCERLGERYLWTDRLCIIQDDPKDKAEQIHAMASIYSSAIFVIINLDGDHMDAGLAGISRDRGKQLRENIQGLLVSPIPKGYLSAYRKSSWYTRGWTYQEGILSKRKLYFDQSQIFYECDEVVWHEDQLSFGRNDFTKISLERHIDGDEGEDEDGVSGVVGVNRSPSFTMGLYGGRNGRFGEYARHLTAYRQRSLTHESDVFDAFYGVLQALYVHEEVLYGTPLCSLDNALLWMYSDNKGLTIGIQQLAGPKTLITTPTWSWGSVVGRVWLSEGEFQGTLVTWSIVVDAPFGSLTQKPIHPHEEPPSWTHIQYRPTNKVTSPRVSMFLAWTEGCLETTPPNVPLWNDISFVDLDQLLISRWPTYRDFWNDAFNGDRDAVPTSLKLGTLCGRAPIASFRLAKRIVNLAEVISIIDVDGTLVGFVEDKDPRIHTEVYPHMNNQDNATFEFVALSVSLGTRNDIIAPKEPYRDLRGQSLECCLAVAVLLIGRQDRYVYRIGSGRIHLRDWVKAKPRFEDIFLL